jgi:hypothetical protein
MCSSSFDLLDLSCSPCLGEVLFTLVPVFVLDLVFWLRSAAQSLLSDFSLRLVFKVSAVFVLEFNFLSLLILRQGSGSVSTKGIFSFPCFSSAVLFFFFEIESLAPAFFRGATWGTRGSNPRRLPGSLPTYHWATAQSYFSSKLFLGTGDFLGPVDHESSVAAAVRWDFPREVRPLSLARGFVFR